MKVFLPLIDAFENLFKGIHYLGPLRENPRHQYTWEGDHPVRHRTAWRRMAIPALLSGRVQLGSIDEEDTRMVTTIGF